MKRLFLLCSFLIVFSLTSSGLEAREEKREQLLEDLIFTSFFPQINRAMVAHYGESKQYWCPRIVHLKKQTSGSFLFEVTIEVETFEGPHNPPHDLVTITFRNDDSATWRVAHFSTKRLTADEHRLRPCRAPL